MTVSFKYSSHVCLPELTSVRHTNARPVHKYKYGLATSIFQ